MNPPQIDSFNLLYSIAKADIL